MQSKAFYKTDGQTLKLTEMEASLVSHQKILGDLHRKKLPICSNIIVIDASHFFGTREPEASFVRVARF
jgi:hypothetical protein